MSFLLPYEYPKKNIGRGDGCITSSAGLVFENLDELVSARTTSRSSVGYRTRYESYDAVLTLVERYHAITISALLAFSTAFSTKSRKRIQRFAL
eukprot:scaffold78742_cov41-Attheya_sp.AAC.3